jgi:Fe2+ transport system protein FeoA
MTAFDLKRGEFGFIDVIKLKNKKEKQRLYDLGFLPNEKIKLYEKISGTVAFEIKSSIFALRKETANKIILK